MAPYGTLAAVSGANPVLGGVIALMLEADPSLTATDIKRILQETARADQFTGAVPNNMWGYGKLDVYAAIKSILGPVNKAEELTFNSSVRVAPNPSHALFHLSQENPGQEAFELGLYDVHGSMLRSAYWSKGQASYTLDMEGFSPGMYFIRGTNSKGGFVKRLIKL